MNRTRLAPALALLAATVSTTWSAAPLQANASPSASTASSTASLATSASPLRLTAPTRVTAYSNSWGMDWDPRLRLVAQNGPFEIWSKRASYRQPIVTEWRGEGGTVTLPEGTQPDFTGLPGFIRMTVFNSAGEPIRGLRRTVCLNGWSERITPEATLRSPYPGFCPYGRMPLGSVQGIQDGWATRLEMYGLPLRLRPGRYTVTAYIPQMYRTPFRITRADAFRTFTLDVLSGSTYECRDCRAAARTATASGGDPGGDLVPATEEPTAVAAGAPSGPLADLRSLPAFGIRIAPGGNYLQFSANVWNSGSSPLVVDGFRRAGEDVMDAYQYFLDAEGNQTGYQLVGTMEWDAKDSHLHWHFRDFARYRLLREDRTQAVRSRKEAFCLANTDAIDYTVPGADWQPDGTDLHTSCGEEDSLSIREVLSAGSGDTYAQFRAGQSFDLRGLPNGIYYIAVEANPLGRLVEQSTTNNVALRKVTIGGVAGARTVKVGPL